MAIDRRRSAAVRFLGRASRKPLINVYRLELPGNETQKTSESEN